MKRKLMCLDDYKVTSTYTIRDGRVDEWTAQLNLYALMLREHGYRVDRIRVVAILRDWQRSKAKHTRDYPQVPVVIIPIEMWSQGKTEAYITDRLIAHGRAQFALPECTPEERWERPAKFALHKDGSSRALSLHDTIEQADIALRERIMTQGQGKREMLYVQERPAEQRRCENYCAAYNFCAQGQKLVSVSDPVGGLKKIR